MNTSPVISACWRLMHHDVKISGAQIRTHDLWIRKWVCYPLHHSAPLRLEDLAPWTQVNCSLLLNNYWTIYAQYCVFHNYLIYLIITHNLQCRMPSVDLDRHHIIYYLHPNYYKCYQQLLLELMPLNVFCENQTESH